MRARVWRLATGRRAFAWPSQVRKMTKMPHVILLALQSSEPGEMLSGSSHATGFIVPVSIKKRICKPMPRKRELHRSANCIIAGVVRWRRTQVRECSAIHC